ncbi:MAG: hypothetical protein QOG63_1958, partial [Thermoleophilaceae bacterium]|nr:hypothetical protein [Thermoleophilaceae bacterium]
MKARTRALKIALAVLTAFALVATAVLAATGGGGVSLQKRKGGHPPSRTVRVLCVRNGSK